VRLTFLGVRGSTPSPGAEFVRYGGNTSCIAVSGGADSVPTLALDAGTGLRSLTGMLGGEPYRGSILVSHMHWDHVMGLPFFSAGDKNDARVDVHVPAQHGLSGRDLMAQAMSPPAFPITPEGLNGSWSFHAHEPGTFWLQGYEVTAFDVEHKGGRAFGYRLARDGVSVAYLPDHAPAAGVSPEALDILEGTDVLIHDAQFVESERFVADMYGHATIGDAVALAERASIGRLVLFHHSPVRVDDALDRITDGIESTVPLLVAHEGMVLDLLS